jgi:hypothetical protein
MGAQLSTCAAAPLGTNFVCAHAGDTTKRIANTSFFIGFSRQTHADRPQLNRIDQKKSTELFAWGGGYIPFACRIISRNFF